MDVLMNKDKFKNLTAKERIEFFKSEYIRGKTNAEIVKEYGLAKETVRNTFKSNGYVFDKTKSQYMLQKDDESNTNECAATLVSDKSTPEVIQTIPQEILQKSYDDNILKTEMISALSWIKEQQEKQSEYDEIIAYVKKQMKHENIIEVPNLEIDTNITEDEVIVRSFRVYEKTLNEFNRFCKGYTHKKQDMFNQALHEFIEKYKK